MHLNDKTVTYYFKNMTKTDQAEDKPAEKANEQATKSHLKNWNMKGIITV